MTEISDETLSRLAALAEAATPGPWHWDGSDMLAPATDDAQFWPWQYVITDCNGVTSIDKHDAAFIAACDPSTVTALIQRLREAEALTNSVDNVASGDGFTTEIRGVKIQRCDEYGMTDADRLATTLAARADAAEARVAELENVRDQLGQSCAAALAERDRLRDGITAKADEWESRARMAMDQANAVAGDRKGSYVRQADTYRTRVVELRALLSPPTADTPREDKP